MLSTYAIRKLDQLDTEDLARILMTFRGQPHDGTPRTGGTRRPPSDHSSPYVVDPQSGLTFLVD